MVGDTVPAWEPVRVPVSGGGEGYKVRRVFCVGRNYAEHAREMGHDGREAALLLRQVRRGRDIGAAGALPVGDG
jgi:fumarylpyruvate hydrolase